MIEDTRTVGPPAGDVLEPNGDSPVAAAEPEVVVGREPPATGWGDGYRPYLDGLRAVAVYLVVLFHAGSDRFGGGYIGVDVFFVLSGFLVTRLLLRDLDSMGSIRFGRFYARRFRRLLPAAFATLIITALVFAAIASPVEVLDAAGGFKAAFLYVTNWYFIAQSTSYFGANLSSNPVLHFWSLAVEEQFYLLWPLLLGGLFLVARRFGTRQGLVLRATVAAGAVASLAWAWTLKGSNPNRAYYGTDARAYQLLAGALLALTPAVIARLARRPNASRWTAGVALAALVAIAATWPSLDAIARGTLITVITVALLAALEAADGGVARRVLSGDGIVYLGKISYGTYLWHWPVILVITRTFDPGPLSTIALTVLIATALASLSFQLLERPVRVSAVLDRHRRTVIATSLAASIIAAAVIIPAITNPTTSTAAVAGQDLTTTGFTPVPTGLNWQAIKLDYPTLPNCENKPATDCTLVHGTGPHILLIGDSHAGMLIPALTALAHTEHLTLSASTMGTCPWQRNLYIVPLKVFGQLIRVEDCEKFKDDTYDRVIPALHPDIIVTMNFPYETKGKVSWYLGPDRQTQKNGSPQYNAWLDKATTDSLAELRAGGRKVVILEPIPVDPNFDPLSCLSQAKVLEQCRYVVPEQPSGLEQTYRRLDKQDSDVWSLDLDRLVCPYFPICDPIVDHQVTKIDRGHLTTAFSRSLAPALDALFKQNGIIPWKREVIEDTRTVGPPAGDVLEPNGDSPVAAAEPEVVVGREPPATGWGDGYRPYLDGLRAVAVYLVVLFHAGSDRFGGGYIGVDVFFVLSGFLVTRLLLRDLDSMGSIRFGRFYARRFRRLLPAVFATLIITALVFAAIASPVEVLDAAGGFKAAFLYVTNWYFIAQSTSYFGANLSSNPVLHFWSLAVEEQFYLLWPLLLGGLFLVARRFGTRQGLVLRATVAAGAVASLVWAWTLKGSNPNRAYYGTDARAYQLLAGALLALTPAVIARLARRPNASRWTAGVALAALVAIAATWPSLDAIARGTLITVITVALLAALEAADGGVARRVLSGDGIVYLGKISYGTYLWHWPVILVITRTFDPGPLSTIALTVLIATALASLSFQLLERPVRVSAVLDRHRRTVIATSLAASIIAAAVIIPAITNPTTSTAAVAGQDLTTTGFTPVPTGLNWQAIKADFPKLTNCYGKPATDCTLVHGTGPHILLIGDSHAGMLIPALTALAHTEHLTLSVSTDVSCPWQRDLYAAPHTVFDKTTSVDECKRIKDDTYDRVIPALHPDIIVTMNFPYEVRSELVPYLGPDLKVPDVGSPNDFAWQEKTTTDSLNALRAGDRKVVLVEPTPFKPKFDPLACLSQATVVQQCRYIAPTEPTDIEQLYRRLDKQDSDVWSLDLDHIVCPYFPICDPIVDHQVTKLDVTHFTRSFMRTVAPAIDAYFKQNGIVPG